MIYGQHNQTIGKDTEEQLVYKHLASLAYDPMKRRFGFGLDECVMCLRYSGIKTDISIVKQSLRLMVLTGFLEEFYSRERDNVIYRLP